VGVDSKGHAYAASLACDETLGNCTTLANASHDSGLAWEPAVSLENLPATPATVEDDYGDVLVDRTVPGHAWIAFDRLSVTPGLAGVAVVETRDGGAHWSSPRVLHHAPPGLVDTFVQLAQAPDGSLHAAFAQLPLSELLDPTKAPSTEQVLVSRSRDGRMWSAGASLGSAEYGVPALTAGPDGVLVAWVDSARPDQIATALSSDTGRHFRQAPGLTAGSAVRAPALSTASDGSYVLLALVEQPAASDNIRRVRATISELGRGTTSWISAPISEPFSLENADFIGRAAGGLYITGLAATDGSFLAVFPAGAPIAAAGPSDIVAERVEISDTAAPATAR
jgi:hypothetical protein